MKQPVAAGHGYGGVLAVPSKAQGQQLFLLLVAARGESGEDY